MNDWTMINYTKFNAEKSGVMLLRADRRQTCSSTTHIQQIPVVEAYKYLGIFVTDSFSMSLDIKNRKETQHSMNKSVWLLRSTMINRDSAHHLWLSLFRSRWHYMVWTIILFTSDMDKWYLTAIYHSLIALFRMKGNPSKEKLFLACFEISTIEFLQAEKILEWHLVISK
jgi:hypothetical protein